MAEVITIKGEVEEKKKGTVGDGIPKWSLKVNGEWYGMLKPSDKAFDAGASLALAWNIAEKVMEGEWVELGYEEPKGYKNIISLAIIAPGEGVPKNKESKDAYWEAKDRREDMRSAIHAAVQFSVGVLQAGSDVKSKDMLTLADEIYKKVRGAE